jgi:hypothetical protein
MILRNANPQQRATLFLCVILGIMLCLTLIYALQQWYSDWHLTHQEAINSVTITPQEAKENLLSAIPNTHIFGQTLSEAGSAPITNLQLRVTGIMSVTPEENGTLSKAYISMSGQSSKIYHTGDNLPYGVKIYAITPDTVILENVQFKPKNTRGTS